MGREEGAEVVIGDGRLGGEAYDRGFFAEPTIFDRVAPDMRIAQEEIFDPVPSVFTGRSVRPRARAAATLAAAMSSPEGTLLRRNPLAPACSARWTYASLSQMPSSTLVTFAEAARIASVVRSPSRRRICRFSMATAGESRVTSAIAVRPSGASTRQSRSGRVSLTARRAERNAWWPSTPRAQPLGRRFSMGCFRVFGSLMWGVLMS
ncbi:aldehyde dehydrogenase family protein [Streptomyces griseoviridis]|uniref:Aldehyde dehydrogenase family protein n=1 Tax=Streptomyces griseoviridis TaxID=45398 RepID=A0A3S9ZPP4_STRGD|nr:aldehyde dehydrogenase family protein [Streptomyces griseoviridis]QCN90879.1 hypothetical protein DDJ31_31895 [Streptomyces griseoviridis]